MFTIRPTVRPSASRKWTSPRGTVGSAFTVNFAPVNVNASTTGASRVPARGAEGGNARASRNRSHAATHAVRRS